MIGNKKILPSSQEYANMPLEEFLKGIKEKGFQCGEIWGGAPHFYTDCYGTGNLNAQKALFKEYDITPILYRPERYGYSLCAEKGTILREASLDYYRCCVEAAAQMGASVLAVEVTGGLRDLERLKLRELAADGLRKITRLCESYKLTLIWKNGREEDGSAAINLKEVKELYDMAADSGSYPGIELDIKSFGQINERALLWFDVFGEKIEYINGLWGKDSFAEQILQQGYQGFLGLGYTGGRLL